MPKELNEAILLVVIGLLTVWLTYRIRNTVKRMIRDEIYKNFPTIKDAIDNFEHRIEYLKIKIDELQHTIKEVRKSQ